MLTGVRSFAQVYGDPEIGRDGSVYQMVCIDESKTVCEYRSVTTSTLSTTSSSADLGQQCEADTQKAVRDCNFEGNSGVQNVMGMAGQLQNAFQQMAAANPQLACSKLGQLSGAASAASAAFNGGCSLAYNKCQTTCASELEQAQTSTNPSAASALENIRRQQRQCQSLASSLNQSVNNIGQFAQMSQSMAFCQTQTGDSWAEHCQKNPADPFCRTAQKATDCSDPTTAATNTVCICQRNPNDPKCGASNQTNFASKTGTDGTANLDDVGGLADFGSGGGISDPGMAIPNQPAQGNLNLGSAGSKGVGVSGGGNSGGRGGAAGGTAGSGLNTKVIGGYGVGGRGGSGFSAGASGGGGTQGGTYAMNAGGRAGSPGVDLKQFLPGGQRDPSRGLAGVSGPDGITGPHSSIWKKVNSRYISVSPSLLP